MQPMSTNRLPGSYRVANQRRDLAFLDPARARARRVERILASIRQDIDNGGTASVRQIMRSPRELYRIELELPEMAYQRITILDRAALQSLLECAGEASLRTRITFR
jgi:hypothetical protein